MEMVDFCAYSCFFISEITCFALSNISREVLAAKPKVDLMMVAALGVDTW